MRVAATHIDASQFSPAIADVFGPYLGEVNLNLGFALEPEPGFVQMAAGASSEPELDGLSQLSANSFDCVLAPLVLHRVRNIVGVMAEIHRVLKPGGHLLVISPYASSDDAWQDPTTQRAFTEKSWHYFDKRIYAKTGQPSMIDFIFEVAEVGLLPYPAMEAAAAQAARHGQLNALDIWKRTQRNVIREMNAILVKVDG